MARINKGSQQQANYYFERGNPEPLDSSMLYNSYSDLKEEIAKDATSIAFAGMYTAVESDNTAYNGPYYINRNKQPERILLKSEASSSYNLAYQTMLSYVANTNTWLYYMLEQPKYTKPNISVQFLSAANNSELTAISNYEAIYEDVEIGTLFTAGIKINWPTRTLDNEYGSRAYDNIGTPDKPNQLLGYSYGVNGSNGISFKFINSTYTTNKLDETITFGSYIVNSENAITVFDNINIAYLKASYMYYPQFYKNGKYEIAFGENDTAWFDNGVCQPKTIKYIVNGKYRYYWGFSDALPMSKSDLQKGNSGLLNNTKFLNGTTTSCVVGDGYDKTYFWVAFPSMYGITEYNENFKVLLEQVDGLMFDLISHNQNMSLKHMSVKLGDSDVVDQYKVAFFKFENPIGNQSSVVSFRILPEEAINYVYTMTDENDKAFELEGESTDTLRTETSNNIIYEEEIFR